MSWRLLEHTADVGIEAEGDDAGACLADAARALSHVLTGADPAAWRADVQEDVRIEAPDLPSLAVAFLAELVWLRDARDLLWQDGAVEVELADEVWRATARMRAVRHHAATHGLGVEVKAVTYHQLQFGPDDAGTWRLRVYLDL